MTSETDIGNMALGLCGARSTITSFTESNPEGTALSLWYEKDRLWCLRAFQWNFARAQDSLTLYATAPGVDNQPATNLPWPFMPWAFSYLYPSDCVDFRYIIPTWVQTAPIAPQPLALPQPPVPFEVSSTLNGANSIQAIFTNQPLAVGVWTKNITNPDLFDSQFTEAFAFRLASDLTISLSGDKALANALFSKAKDVIAEAAARSGSEGLRVQDSLPDWIRVRGYTADYQFPWNQGNWPGWPLI